MPRKKKLEKVRRKLTLDALPIPALLDFLVGWCPPRNEFERGRSRWQTWAEFDAEYLAVRDEFLQHEWVQNSIVRGQPVFAEERFLAKQRGEAVAIDAQS